ncbi:MAG: glycosyltransferase family 2 protein, partial [Thermodesulfovibrionales bacterium]|nr:glycosyltransferase family 2 protein [Thermodesulfovibrionales bacterium]
IILGTLKSVLAQTVHELEVIVVDDGSEDDTVGVVRSLNDSRLRYFYKTNGGAASARNLGLSKANGGYIAFLDSDDLWPDNYLEVMINHLESSSTFGAAYCAITVIYPDGRKVISHKRPAGKSGWITLDLFKRGFIWTSAAVFKSSAWKDFYFDELLKTSEDSDAFLRLSMHTQFLFVPDVEAFRRISADGLCAKVGVACTRMIVLERFYLRLGGDKIIPTKIARKRFSHAARRVAEDRRSKGARAAALGLYRHAIRYWPYDLRLYLGFLRTLLLSSRKDQQPNWKMPEPLVNPIGPNRFA